MTEHTAGTSPQLSPHKCDLSQETGEISFPVPPPPFNGNHVHDSQSQVAVSEEGSVSLRPLQKSLPLSVSLQNLRARAEAPGGGRAGDGGGCEGGGSEWWGGGGRVGRDEASAGVWR